MPLCKRRLLYRLPLPLILLLAGGPAAVAQTSRAGSGRTQAKASHPAPEEELAPLEKAQVTAVAAGDTAAIATTSRQLVHAILKNLANTARNVGDTAHAADLEAEAHDLDQPPASEPAASGASSTAPSPPAAAAAGASVDRQRAKRKLLAEAYNDLGTAEAREGQYLLAKLHFEAAARWDVPTPTLLRNLGTAAFRIGDYPTAARALGQFLQSEPAGAAPTDPRSQLMYALALFSAGDFPGAAAAFKPVSEETLRDPRSAYSWAFSLARSGDPKQANAIAAQLSTEPLPPQVLALVCHIFVDTESYGQSVDCYRHITAAAPTFPLAHYQVGESLIRLDRPAEAIPELQQELTLSPDDPNVQYSMAFALLQTSRKEEAGKLLTAITSAHPEMAQPQYQLGKLLVEGGDTAAAIPHLEAAEKVDPSLDYVHYQLQAAYRRSGRIADADREAALYREIKARHRDQPAAR